MSTQKVPVTFLGGYSPRKGLLGILAFPDMLKGDQIRLDQITLPAGVTATIEPDALLAQVVAPRVEAEPEEG